MQNDTNKKRRKFWVKLQQPKPKIIDGRYILREISDVFFAKSGLLYTIKKMFISPGKSVRHYLREDRKPFVRPIVFVIITSLIFALVDFFLPIFENLRANHIVFITPFFVTTYMGEDSAVLRWIADMSAYTTILLGLWTAFFTKLFFRKSGYNFFEIFVLLCYVCGISMLFYSVASIINNLTTFRIMGYDVVFVMRFFLTIYIVWAVGQFFYEKQYGIVKKTMLYIKAYLSYCLGVVLFVETFGVLFVLFGSSSISGVSEVLLRILHNFINVFTFNLL